MNPSKQAKRYKVLCCYCGNLQECPEPPGLVECTACGHSFRTYLAEPRVCPMELSDVAKRHFTKKRIGVKG